MQQSWKFFICWAAGVMEIFSEVVVENPHSNTKYLGICRTQYLNTHWQSRRRKDPVRTDVPKPKSQMMGGGAGESRLAVWYQTKKIKQIFCNILLQVSHTLRRCTYIRSIKIFRCLIPAAWELGADISLQTWPYITPAFELHPGLNCLWAHLWPTSHKYYFFPNLGSMDSKYILKLKKVTKNSACHFSVW